MENKKMYNWAQIMRRNIQTKFTNSQGCTILGLQKISDEFLSA